MLSNATLQRPRSLFTLALLTLCVTLFLSYERIRSYAFGPFLDILATSSSSTTDDDTIVFDDIVISKADQLVYQLISDSIGTISYGTAARPKFKDMPELVIDTLPERFIPSVQPQNTTDTDNDDDSSSSSSVPARRLIIIGDVHGQKKALEALLEKLDFDNRNGDHLVFTGDLINKGPDSPGVVALAMELGAHSVRGNHEDRVLLAHASMARKAQVIATAAASAGDSQAAKDGESAALSALKAYQAAENALSKGEERDRATALALSDEQIKWLAGLPLILRIGSIPPGATADPLQQQQEQQEQQQQQTAMENVLVVHAGLVPKVPLEAQDPWAVMNMRTVTYPIDEIRRDAVKSFLLEKADAQTKGKGKNFHLKALQDVDGDSIDQELKRMSISQGFEPGNHIDDVAIPSEGRGGKPWYEEWSAYQQMLANKRHKALNKKSKKNVADEQDNEAEVGEVKGEVAADQEKQKQEPITTIVYGHDAKSGLQVPKVYREGKKGYTFGLDTGCVYGKSLTALVIEMRDGSVAREIVQVDCEKALDTDK